MRGLEKPGWSGRMVGSRDTNTTAGSEACKLVCVQGKPVGYCVLIESKGSRSSTVFVVGECDGTRFVMQYALDKKTDDGTCTVATPGSLSRSSFPDVDSAIAYCVEQTRFETEPDGFAYGRSHQRYTRIRKANPSVVRVYVMSLPNRGPIYQHTFCQRRGFRDAVHDTRVARRRIIVRVSDIGFHEGIRRRRGRHHLLRERGEETIPYAKRLRRDRGNWNVRPTTVGRRTDGSPF